MSREPRQRPRRQTLGEGGRLGTISALVPRGSRVADIGSGHGLLARQLLFDGRASFCVATERTASRAEQIRLFPAGHPLAEAGEVRWGDGIEPLEPHDRIDVLVLAGMGGRSIRRILADPAFERLGPSRVVLQPQTEPAELRRWLRGRGLGIVDERMAEDRGRRYVAIAAGPGAGGPTHPAFSDDELDEIGPVLLQRREPLLQRWWSARLDRLGAVARRAGEASEGGRRAAEQAGLARRVLAALGEKAAPPA